MINNYVILHVHIHRLFYVYPFKEQYIFEQFLKVKFYKYVDLFFKIIISSEIVKI